MLASCFCFVTVAHRSPSICRADAAGVRLAAARRLPGADTEDLHRRGPHGALAAVPGRERHHHLGVGGDGSSRRLLLRSRRRWREEDAQRRRGSFWALFKQGN